MIDGKDGRYLVDCDGKGYTITSENDGSIVRLDFEESEKTGNVTADGNTYKLMTFVDDNHVELPAIGGGTTVVELSQAGVMAYRDIASGALMAAR